MGVIIGNEETNYAKDVDKLTASTSTDRRPAWTITIHAGLFWKNFRFKVSALRWFTATDRAILAWHKQNKKRVPKRLVITITRGK
jgi:hypothetical protein